MSYEEWEQRLLEAESALLGCHEAWTHAKNNAQLFSLMSVSELEKQETEIALRTAEAELNNAKNQYKATVEELFASCDAMERGEEKHRMKSLIDRTVLDD